MSAMSPQVALRSEDCFWDCSSFEFSISLGDIQSIRMARPDDTSKCTKQGFQCNIYCPSIDFVQRLVIYSGFPLLSRQNIGGSSRCDCLDAQLFRMRFIDHSGEANEGRSR
jgi:hypothetical protein